MKSSLLLALVAFAAAPCFADEAPAARRGLITTAPCPFGCRDLKLGSDVCRETKDGDECVVEDFTQPPGHQSMIKVRQAAATAPTKNAPESGRRGLVTTAPCPYSCKSAGLPAESCREFKDGDKCTVEDFTQPPGHRSLLRLPPANAVLSSGRRGLITSSSCPYDCATANVSAPLCREWTDGEKCYVEDLSQPPGHRSRARLVPAH